jgi:hypothetical protein
MKDWKNVFENLTEKEKRNLAILRVLECTNGIIQYSYRRNDPWALSIEDTRKSMKFSMSCIKNMQIPLKEETITFGDDLAETFGQIRDLYVSGTKKGNKEDFSEFMRISSIMINVLGKERILEAQKVLSQQICDIPPDKLQWGVDYMMQFIVDETKNNSD